MVAEGRCSVPWMLLRAGSSCVRSWCEVDRGIGDQLVNEAIALRISSKGDLVIIMSASVLLRASCHLKWPGEFRCYLPSTPSPNAAAGASAWFAHLRLNTFLQVDQVMGCAC